MTVGELIGHLSKLDPSLPVVVTGGSVIRLEARRSKPDWNRHRPHGYIISPGSPGDPGHEQEVLHLVEADTDADIQYSARMRTNVAGRLSIAEEP